LAWTRRRTGEDPVDHLRRGPIIWKLIEGRDCAAERNGRHRAGPGSGITSGVMITAVDHAHGGCAVFNTRIRRERRAVGRPRPTQVVQRAIGRGHVIEREIRR
jgi:hypothetical protein